MILMQSDLNSYVDWKDFFKRKLTDSGLFHLNGLRKDDKNEIEIYASSISGFKTTIEIAYRSPLCLMFLHLLNPFTPGMNRQQERSFFHQNDFYPHSNRDRIGLEFDEINLRWINEYLSEGWKGSETVYIRNGKPVKSVLKSNAFPWTDDTWTIYFVKPILTGSDNQGSLHDISYDQSIEIDLHSIYPGTN